MKKEKIGCYVTAQCCVDCNWFSQPFTSSLLRLMPFPRCICPDCGGIIKAMIGRYVITEEVEGFFFKDKITRYTGFLRKDDEVKKVKKKIELNDTDGLKSILFDLRMYRDYEQDQEVKSIYNNACDRVDVAISKLNERK